MKHIRPHIILLFTLLQSGCGDPVRQETSPLDGPASDGSNADSAVHVESALPVLSNFRILDGSRDRIHFDSSEAITASAITGFTVSLKTITAITVGEGKLTGHYFTVSTPFTYWENNTIRYEGGGNLIDLDGDALCPFTLTYVHNTIVEPPAAVDRYVSTTGSGAHDGTSASDAWTFQEALSKATAGQTVWIRAGNYGNLNLTMANQSGTPSSPIKFVGYKATIGDITSNYFDNYPAATWSSAEMPTLTGVSATSGTGLYISNCKYIVFRNIQITQYQLGIQTPAKNNWNESIVIDNSNFKEFGNAAQKSGVGLAFYSYNSAVTKYVGNTKIRVTNAIINNYSMGAVSILGDGQSLIKNLKAYNDMTERADYQITIAGDHSIITNCYVENVDNTDNRSTHGIGVRSGTRLSSTYNLIADSEAVNMNEAFYLRNFGASHNVVKDCVARNNSAPAAGESGAYRGGVYIWGGADFNTIERVDIHDAVVGIGFKDNAGEDESSDTTIGKNNLIRDCTFNKVSYAISFVQQTKGVTGAIYDNKIINCTFNDVGYLWQNYYGDVKNLKLVNSTFSSIKQWAFLSPPYVAPPNAELHFSNSNFWNNGFAAPAGVKNVEMDPMFVDAGKNNMQLKASSPIKDKGSTSPDSQYDMGKVQRTVPYSIGAYEKD